MGPFIRTASNCPISKFWKITFQILQEEPFLDDIFFCEKATRLVLLMKTELNSRTHNVRFPRKCQAFKFWKMEVRNEKKINGMSDFQDFGKLEKQFHKNWNNQKLEADKWMEQI